MKEGDVKEETENKKNREKLEREREEEEEQNFQKGDKKLLYCF